MTSRQGSPASPGPQIPDSHYALLGLSPWASEREIRNRYRELSKLYHPDTTQLPAEQAIEKFRQLNEAYATLSNIERRTLYDRKIGFSRLYVAQPPKPISSSAYLDPTDRPLSAGEIFALFVLALTFVACLALVIVIGLVRGEKALQPLSTLAAPQPVQEWVEQENVENNVRLDSEQPDLPFGFQAPGLSSPDLPDSTHVPAIP
ncbi:J domain-containing protein [Leptolyngbya sp. FACHB-261]|uniref:J domain-containing protein n=1 Tax=Leptolyngbya sp. FACHB-261 TaxID=2692806 RepID=UPI001681D3BC|nr:DnaJ domain-containing protein [Leptolyngbya sp. FACHB-261]MBD2105034.1 J domain-containing protein [Leptolyngbya sp. FACHB-261]